MSNIKTPRFRVSYPHVLKPQLNKLNGKEEYSVMALFPKGTDLTALKKEVQRVMTEKWGDKLAGLVKEGKIRTPFRLHDEKATTDEKSGKKIYPQGMEEGGVFITLKSSQAPGVVNQQVKDIESESEFYAGCYAIASVRAYAYEQAGNRGVSFGLVNIQKVAEGDPLGSRVRPQDDFAPIEAEAAGSAAGDATSLF